MGLDIYAGTLTRYYSHNWKTVVQQWAEENGYSFNRITPDEESADNEEELSPAEIQETVESWRDQIITAIAQPGYPPYAPWPEDIFAEARDYARVQKLYDTWTDEDEVGCHFIFPIADNGKPSGKSIDPPFILSNNRIRSYQIKKLPYTKK